MAEARTIAEAYLYLELILPPGESEVDYHRHTTLHRLDDDRRLLRFDGPYEGSHHTVEVVVSGPAERLAEEAEQPYGAGRSKLIDAGQWFVIESAYVGLAEAAVERLAGGAPDESTYWTAVQAWDAAGAAVAEIGKFLPPGAEDVPAEAFWTEHGRRVRQQRRDVFRRARIADAGTFYQRRLDEFRSWSGGSAQPAASVPAPRPPADPSPALPLPARTYGEAHVYMDVHPCDCGSSQFPRSVLDVLASDDQGVVIEYAGPCDHCGQPRDFTFRLPQRPGLPPESPYLFSFPGDGPSRLLDAGDWAAIGEGYGGLLAVLVSREQPTDQPTGHAAGRAPEGASDSLPDPADIEDTLKVLTFAAAAVDEVLAFFPDGAESLPDGAFFTPTGDEFRRLAPDRLHRSYLERQRAERWRRVEEFTARYGR